MTLSYIPSDTNDEGILKATASGVLPNGKPVVVNADGTVSVVAVTSISQNIGSDVAFSTSGDDAFVRVAVDPSASKVVIIYRNAVNSDYGEAVVGEISGESISFGTPVVFFSGTAGYQNVVFEAGSGKFVVTYNSGGAKAVVGTVSGTSISFGSTVTITSDLGGNANQTTSASLNKIVAISVNDATGGFAHVGTISGTSISFGTAVKFANDVERFDGSQITYDSDTDQVVICYRDNDNSNLGTAIVGSVSGTSISFGSATVFSSSDYREGNVVYDSSSKRIVVLYAVTSSTLNRAIVGTVSGTSISFGAEVSGLTTTNSVYSSLVFDSNVNKVVFFRLAVGVLSADYGTVSGDTISFAGPVTIKTGGNSSGNGIVAAVFDSGTSRIAVGYLRSGDNGTSFVLRTPGDVANLTASNYIGISTGGTYADGSNATVKIIGNTSDEQSGLTAGQAYYVQTDGTIGTTPADPSVFAGTAISATKMLVKT